MQDIFLYMRKNKELPCDLMTHSLIVSRIFIIQVALLTIILQKEVGRGAHTLSECCNEFNKFSFATINLNYKSRPAL
jgi:hypothetical protein